MMYQCGRCGLTRASGQEIGVIQKCKCPWEFVPPVSPQRTWVGLTNEEVITMSRYDLECAALIGEVHRRLKERNT